MTVRSGRPRGRVIAAVVSGALAWPGAAALGQDLAPVRVSEQPPTARIASSELPRYPEALRILRQRAAGAPAGSRTAVDLAWLARFDRLAHKKGAPRERGRTAELAMRVNGWWYARRPSPRLRVILRLPSGILANYRTAHGFAINPVATAGRWRDLNADVPAPALARALRPLAVPRRNGRLRWRAFEYYDVQDTPAAVRPGVSGMAQARVALLYAAAYSAKGDLADADMSLALLRAFEVPVDSGGVRAVVTDPVSHIRGTWFPERAYPGENPWKGAALNGFLATIIDTDSARTRLAAGVRRHAASLDATGGTAPRRLAAGIREMRDLTEEAADSVATFLPMHDTGSWSIYGMLTPGHPWGSYLADLNYHCYHIELLRNLDLLHPGFGFGDTADRWERYVQKRQLSCPRRSGTSPTGGAALMSPFPSDGPDTPPTAATR